MLVSIADLTVSSRRVVDVSSASASSCPGKEKKSRPGREFDCQDFGSEDGPACMEHHAQEGALVHGQSQIVALN